MKQTDYHAKLEIHDLPKFNTQQKKKKLVEWLRRWAKEINNEKDMKIYAKKFTARLMK